MVTWARIETKLRALEAAGTLPVCVEVAELTTPATTWTGDLCTARVCLATDSAETRIQTHDGAWHAV